MYRIDADNGTNSQQVFVRTPKGDQVLDYNNPESLRWLRQAEESQRKSLESLIGRGSNKAFGRTVAPQSLKTGLKESKEMAGDFGLVLY